MWYDITRAASVSIAYVAWKLEVGSTDNNHPLEEAFRATAIYQHKMLRIYGNDPTSGR
jgi:hypothetical protein